MHWRRMRAADLPAVERIAEFLHPDYPEHPAVFAERLALAPIGCWVLAVPAGQALAGYAVTHPWTGRGPPRLNALLGGVPRPAPAWHIHDVALLPAARGGGRGTAVLRQVLARALAAGCVRATLVAVAGKAGYWQRLGFRPAIPVEPITMASYGPGAVFMARPIIGRPGSSVDRPDRMPIPARRTRPLARWRGDRAGEA
jgi:GNAT superfamily N-acetyltransferase